MTTCKISKVCEGGPLFDYDGNFLGMNISFSTEGTLFMPNSKVLENLWNCCASLKYIKFPKELRTVADAGHDGYASRVLDWTIAGDHSVWFNSWFVPLPFWTSPDDLKRHDFEMRMRRPRFVCDLSDFAGVEAITPFLYNLRNLG